MPKSTITSDSILKKIKEEGMKSLTSEELRYFAAMGDEKKPAVKKKKISADSLKKGTALDPGYASRVQGKDATGEYLSPEERKAQFKKTKITGADIKRGSSVGGAEKVAADTTGSSALAIRKPSASGGVKPDDVKPSDTEVEKGGALAKPTESLVGPLKKIDSGVDGILTTLKQSNKIDADARADARKEAEKQKRKKAEGKLEGVGAKLGDAAQRVLKPVQNIFEKIWNFLKIVFFGRIAVKLFEWFTNPENTKKVSAIFRFLKDWWPVLVAGIMAIVGPGMIFTAGLIALLVWGIPKIIDAVKWVGSLFGMGVDKELKNVEADADKFGKDTVAKIEEEGVQPKEEGEEEKKPPEEETTPAEIGETEQQSQDLQQAADKAETPQEAVQMAGGGQVPGTGNGDTVPAMLTPGEFVMSKGAVQQYGSSTLAGMNAAAGGTNRPTRGRYNTGGMVHSSRSLDVPSVTYSRPVHPLLHYKGGGVVQYFKGGGKVEGLPGLGGGGTGTNSLTEQAKTKTLATWIGDGIQELFGKTPARMMDTNTGENVLVTTSPSSIGTQTPSQPDIAPPGSQTSSEDDPVAVAQARLAARAAPSQELPEFNASKMRSGSKIKTLGITV